MKQNDQLSIAHLIGLIGVVAIGLSLVRIGLDGASLLILAGAGILLAAAGGVIGFIGHGRDGILGGAVVWTFIGMLACPLVGTAIAVLAAMISYD